MHRTGNAAIRSIASRAGSRALECDEAAAEAMFEAGREWDGWQARARAAVDRALAAAPSPLEMVERAGNSAPDGV